MAESTAAVNDAFSRFDDPYYQGISKAYSANYMPQVEEQFSFARNQLPLTVPSVDSSAYGTNFSGLTRDYERGHEDDADHIVWQASI